MAEELENYIEYLFSAALKKCGDISDAEDLTQETLLAAYAYLARGHRLENPKAWLSSTLNHKYYDALRKKYRLPLVSVDVIPEEPFWETYEQGQQGPSQEEQVRREVAYLAAQYREVIIRHYLLGQKVQQIAEELRLPKGTVLSRLSSGREQMRKGLEKMENYEKQSYAPERLDLGIHGCPGLHEEPWSLVRNNLLRQNILILAYERPVTTVDLARGLGVPTPYIEEAVNTLVAAELMCRNGSRVFTDFLITTPEQQLRALDAEIQFAERHYAVIWKLLEEAISALQGLDWYTGLAPQERVLLEYYYILHIFVCAIYNVSKRIIPAEETFPARPDGGRWIALGHRYPRDFDFSEYPLRKYDVCGERRAFLENYLAQKSVCLHVYDTQPDLNKYQHGPVEIHDDDLCKLLFLLLQGISFQTADFNTAFLEDIPHLAECGILRMEDGQPRVAIPVISKAAYEEMAQLQFTFLRKLADVLEDPLRALFPHLKTEIPKQLKGRIAEFRQYSCYEIIMAVLKKAIKEERFLKGVTYPTPPMVLVIEK